MSSGILPGVIRGLGKARIKFDLVYKNKKIGRENSKKFSFLEKLNLKEKEFSRSALFKTLKHFAEPEPDEVLFWTLLKLINAEEVGGLCVLKSGLIKFILEKNPSLDPEKSWKNYFETNSAKPILFQDEEMIYLTHLYNIEVTVCNYLRIFFESGFKEKFKVYKDKNLSEEQVSIVNSIFQNSISFLSGGPGTGKTTIIQAILRSGIDNGIAPESIAILAPTGKAAKRLHESCQSLLSKYQTLQDPSTIHRFLGYNPSSGKYKFNTENPIQKKLIIVDESSMIDIFILKTLLEAYPKDNDRRIIFVGDPDQLLSVNSGSVFSDFILLNKNVFKLSKSFRQTSEGEEIKSLANKIQNLKSEDTLDILLKNVLIQKECTKIESGVTFLETTREEDSVNLALDWYKKITKLGFSGQILTPYNETKIGVRNINAFLETELAKTLSANYKLPVIVNTNLYNLKLFNGETGYLSTDKNVYSFLSNEKAAVPISSSYRQYFDSAYAITVHKSQGSEYDHVCILIPAEMENPDSLLNIRILYTAITRAKKSVTLIGSLTLFQKALLNRGEERHSRIAARLK